jgi:putative molybdopterin biosynthesis protein
VTGDQGARFLTVNEVANRLRVSNMTVYRILSRGEMPYLAIGKTFRIEQADLEAYLERAVRP